VKCVTTCVVTVLLLVLVSACGGSSSSSTGAGSAASRDDDVNGVQAPSPQSGGALTVLMEASYSGAWPTGLDPATNTTGGANQSQMNAIFGQLFQLTEDGKLKPDLATDYKYEDGGKSVLITLRDGVKFTDGTPLDADAFIWNIKRDMDSPCTCKPLWQLKDVSAVDDHTVRIDLKTPNGALVNGMLVSNVNWLASPTAFKKMGPQQFKMKPVGAGPFKVVSNQLSNELVLERNPDYWEQGRPYLDKLTFRSTANDESALQALQAGQAQVYEGMSTPSLLDAYKNAGLTVTKEPSTSPYVVQLNTKAPPFDDKRAREAIYAATNSQLIVEKLFDNAETVTQSFTAPGGLFYQKDVPGYPPYDLDKAKQLVKELGGLKVDFFTLQSPVNTSFMKALQTMWQQAGIETTIHLYTLNGLIQEFQKPNWQAALQTAGAWDPAAGVGVSFRFSSTSPYSGVKDPKVDDLINQGQGSVDPAERKKAYDELGAYIAQNAYAPFLFPLSSYSIATDGVYGPGITTQIPTVAVDAPIQYQNVFRTSGQ
jgi:peptide/nickel transport system substrate-binding protein